MNGRPEAVLVRVCRPNLLKDVCYGINSQNHQYIHLNSDEFTIGRDNHCQYTFDTLDVSRKHLMFQHDGSGWKVTDLSSNGTWLTRSNASECKLVRNVATPVENLCIVTLKQCPEISYVLLENINPIGMELPEGNMTLKELYETLSRPRRRAGVKRQLPSQQQCCPSPTKCTGVVGSEKRHCPVTGSSQDDMHQKSMAIIKEQARLINELTRKVNAAAKLFNCEDYTCSICLNIVVKPTTLVPCQHVFCHQCISQFREKICAQRAVLFCPMCRSQPNFFFLNKSHQKTIDLILESTLSEQELAERKKIERDYCEAEKSVSKIFQTVQSEFMFNTPPVVLTDSNQIEEIEDFDEFFSLFNDVDDSDDNSDVESEEIFQILDLDSDSDAGNSDIEIIQDQYFHEQEQNISVSF